jgi:hypothetical protein
MSKVQRLVYLGLTRNLKGKELKVTYPYVIPKELIFETGGNGKLRGWYLLCHNPIQMRHLMIPMTYINNWIEVDVDRD